MMKRIIAVLIVLALAIGCAFALAETTTAEPTPIPEGKTRYVSAPSGLYIRATAELDGEIVATLDFNYALKVIGEEGKWSHVIFETGDRVFEGYAWTAYLSDHKTVLKPAVKAEPTAEPPATPNPQPPEQPATTGNP